MSRIGLILLATFVLLAAPLWADKAGSYFKQGRRAEIHKQYDAAYSLFQRALDLHPDNVDYMIAARRARFEAAMAHIHRGDQLTAQKQYPEAQVEFQKAATLDPSNEIAQQKLQQLEEWMHPAPPPPGEAVTPAQEDSLRQRLARAAGPVELGSVASIPINLKLAGDSRVAYNTLGKLSGINVIFDPDYHGSNVTLSLNQVSLMEALRILDMESRSFYTVVTPNTIFVTNDSLQKRSDLQQMVIKTFYLHNVSQAAELTEVAQAVRVLLNLQHFQPVASQMALVIRDTPDRVAVAQKIIDDLDKAPAEVVVDVKVLQVNRDVARDLGLLPPTSTTLSLVNTQPASTGSSSGSSSGTGTGTGTGTGSGSGSGNGSSGTTLNSLKHLTGANFAITISPATLNALLSNDATRTVQEPELRAIQGQKATLQIGQRIPIATGSFQPGIGGVGINPLVNTQFTYQPVGVNIDLTPWIHGDNEVTLKSHIEISAVDNFVNIGGISQPVIGQKVIDHTIELKNGESNILGGIFEDQDIKNLSGIPGLSSIPGLKWLFSSTHNEKVHTEVMIVMTPHIVRHLDLSKFNERAIDTGTQNDITLHELPPATMAPAAAPTAAPQAGQPAPVPQQQPGETGPATAPPSTTPRTVPPPAGPARPQAAAAPTTGAAGLQFNPPRVSGVVGNPFGVNLDLDNATNAYSVSLQLNYDPRMVNLQSVVNGDFLSQDGQAVALVNRNDPTTGTAQITLSRPPNVGGITGSGSILTLTFEGKAAGATTISVSRVIARDAQGKVMQLQTGSAAVTIR